MGSGPAHAHGIVIIGGGQAGSQVASSLRERGYAAPIVLLGNEARLPYQRPPLSKAFLDGKSDGAELAVRAAAFYAQGNIALSTEREAISIDRNGRTVATDDGSCIPYDHLVLATGSRNRQLHVPGIGLDGVHQLRSLDDAKKLRDALARASSIVIVGAGFVGLELAALASGRGHRVDMIELSDRPMARAVSETTSAFYRNIHTANGVTFHFGRQVVRINGADGRVVSVDASGGLTLAADLVLVGVGALVNDELARAAGLLTANGIVVNEQLLTDDPCISAIGDCAAYPQPFAGGTTMRIESVQNAVDQARHIAARLTGAPAAYAAIPWFWSDQGRWKLQIAGLSAGHDQSVIRGDMTSGAFSVFCFRQGCLVAVESVNRPADHMIARKLIAQHIALSPDMAADLTVDLKTLTAGGRAAA